MSTYQIGPKAPQGAHIDGDGDFRCGGDWIDLAEDATGLSKQVLLAAGWVVEVPDPPERPQWNATHTLEVMVDGRQLYTRKGWERDSGLVIGDELIASSELNPIPSAPVPAGADETIVALLDEIARDRGWAHVGNMVGTWAEDEILPAAIVDRAAQAWGSHPMSADTAFSDGMNDEAAREILTAAFTVMEQRLGDTELHGDAEDIRAAISLVELQRDNETAWLRRLQARLTELEPS